MKQVWLSTLTFCFFMLNPPTLWAAEIRVALFGQPCLLSGPQDAATLKVIHSISPEQAYPTQTASDFSENPGAQIRQWLKKLQTATGVPDELDAYREKLGKRLEAQAAFFDALEEARKSKDTQPLVAIEKSRFRAGTPESSIEEFTKAAKKAAATGFKKDDVDRLFDAFNERTETDPEEEFHRGIHKLNIQYACSFEEQAP